jgi:hypothetical protein
MKTHIVYECGICNSIHPWEWNGDCRDNNSRYGSVEEYAEAFGVPDYKVIVRSMEDRIQADTGLFNYLTQDEQDWLAESICNDDNSEWVQACMVGRDAITIGTPDGRMITYKRVE